LQNEYGVRIYVDKEEVNGMRSITLKPYTNRGGCVDVDENAAALQRCRDRILAMSDEAQL
jgi:hypothetical protein